MSIHHFTSFLDFTPEFIQNLVNDASEIKRGNRRPDFHDKTLAMLFFNPSLRTRVSFENAMQRFGGHTVVLAGNGAEVWALEYREGVMMNGHKVEHVKDAAKVLGRLCDAVAIRSFASMNSFQEDQADHVIHAFKRFSGKPVISMESAVEHPCQALADMLTIQERCGRVRGKKMTLTWAPHIKPLPTAVPHSALLAAAYSGMDVTLVHPPGFELGKNYLNRVAEITSKAGRSFTITQDQFKACQDAHVIYAKSWGATAHYGDQLWHDAHLPHLSDWQVSDTLCAHAELFLHCLPVRRNVEVSDSVLDSAKSGIYDEAENRYWAQVAVLASVF